MKPNRLPGLLVALLIVLATVGLAASGLSLNQGAAARQPANSPTQVTAIAAQATSTSPAQASATPAPTTTATSPPAPSPTASPSATEEPEASPTPEPSPTPAPTEGVKKVIGESVQGRPITAHRIGEGPIKVVLIGDIHGGYEANSHELAEQLLAYFVAHPGEVPPDVSLWIVPSANPDGLATGHRWNANDVDLNRNADTDLDGCAGNDWSPDTMGLEGEHPGAGGPYPFSEPEARALRDFMDDAWIAISYHSAAEAIFVDTCQHHLPTARLAQAVSAGTGYEVPEEGWSGYRITGEFGDYLAGEGVAAITVELTDKVDPEFERNLAGVQAMLTEVDEIISTEAGSVGAGYVWLDDGNTGAWHYVGNSFLHPLALEVLGDTAYLLDGGRVLAQDLSQAEAPHQLLASGDYVEKVRVLEPLDLAADGDALLALDRAGDVYRYDPASRAWSVERYDRPSGESSDHYFVALSSDRAMSGDGAPPGGGGNYLLETTHEQVVRFADGKRGKAWAKLPQGRDVDVSAYGGDVYVLARNMNNPRASLLRYQDGKRVPDFQPNVDLMHPRQVVAGEDTLYVLDRSGRRLLALDPESGDLLALYQFSDRQDVSAIWADPSGERLILAGRDALYFYGEPERAATIQGGPLLEGPQPHDLALLEDLRGLSVPIEGATVTSRDFQMPGAPRHYRLGVHEGMDWYGHTIGVTVNRRTPVRAIADGVVVRALTDHERLTEAQANAWYAESLKQGYTPAEVLDGYRGRQVWIDHGNGVLSRYAHLGAIAEGIVEDVEVSRGQVIATVGNSGTPGSVNSETFDVHLHTELWTGDCASLDSEACHFVGQFLRPIEAREWLERILR